MHESKEPQQPQHLIDLLSEQRDLYGRLRELSEQQRTLITGDRPETLLSILRERQTLVGALIRLNEQLAPFRRNWEREHAALPQDLRAQADHLLRDINGLLREILRTDQEDGHILAARKQAVGQQMDALADGRSANAAYAHKSAPDGAAHAADMTG
jgi:hypothetical protein